ncbi:acyl-CoA dehydrogenase family protein [Streptomyces sp. NPDC050560]|uniref:acyl-CoA dehydrogenase family protein n=1 Tax=Streptomyces sp. NPDC050560 TaxID=3365630 RepID=UPI0037BA60DC
MGQAEDAGRTGSGGRRDAGHTSREPGAAPAFALTAAERARRAELRELAAARLRPLADAGPEGRVNRPLLAALGELGLLREAFESGALGLCLLRESLAYSCTEAETALALQGLGGYPLRLAGGEEQRRRWLPGVTAGSAVAAFALSEPGAGSDAAALELTAHQEAGGDWRLTGTKSWISNAPDADVYTVFARTGPEAGARGITAFLLPGDRPGLTGERLDMLAPHAIGTLVLDGVPVGPGDVLGEVGRGFGLAMRTLDLFRPSVGAFALGMAEAALDATLRHTASRAAFGGTLGDLQAVRHRAAEMATRTEAARLLVYAAAAAYDRGDAGVAKTSAMAKLFATEAAQYVVDSAVQLHGARALRRGHPLERLYREVRAPRIYEGASEVQRTVIARELYRRLPPEEPPADATAPSHTGPGATQETP